MRAWALDLFFVVLCSSFIFYASVVIAGIQNTQRVGTPSISRMLADDFVITCVYVASVILYGELRVIVTIVYILDDWSEDADSCRHFWTVAANVCGNLQILFLVLIAVVTLDVDETSHLIVAGIAGVFSWLREGILLGRRYEHASKPVFFFNAILWLLLLGFMLSYAVLSYVELGQQPEEFVSSLEYFVFADIVFLPTFQLYDLGADALYKRRQAAKLKARKGNGAKFSGGLARRLARRAV